MFAQKAWLFNDRACTGEEKVVEAELVTLDKDLEAAIIAGDIEAAGEIRTRQKELSKKIAKKNSGTGRSITITESDIADVVSVWTKIPVSRLTEKESKRLERLETELHKRVVGQEEAVSAVAKAIREAVSDSGSEETYGIIPFPWTYWSR